MAYVKPGVEITQVQESATPVLVTPDLEVCVIAQSYYFQEMEESSVTYSGASTAVALTTVNATYDEISSVDHALVMVDIQDGGYVKHLVKGPDFSVATATNITTVTISGAIQPDGANNPSNGVIKVGYRGLNAGGQGYKTLPSITDISNTYGQIKSYNTAAYAASVALANSSSSVNVYGMAASATSDVSTALGALETKEVYALAVCTQKSSGTQATNAGTHVTSLSAATEKKERIAFVSKVPTYSGTAMQENSTEKAQTALNIKTGNSGYTNKRLFSLHPEAGYVAESRHISSLKPSWIAASFSDTSSIGFGVSTSYDLFAKFAAPVTVNSVNYLKGDEITDAVWSNLKDNFYNEKGSTTIDVLAPVPGYYYAAAVAGQVAGKTPEQPLTNVPMGGITNTWGSNDYFSESNLNTMAEGGTYILNELSPGVIVSRHQMSTDITSVAKRELSITNSLDYTAKFIRKALKPYIGKFTINPSFIKLVNTILVGIGLFLTRQGTINDLQVVSVVQDGISPDTLNVEVKVLVKYPVNYIKLKLIF